MIKTKSYYAANNNIRAADIEVIQSQQLNRHIVCGNLPQIVYTINTSGTINTYNTNTQELWETTSRLNSSQNICKNYTLYRLCEECMPHFKARIILGLSDQQFYSAKTGTKEIVQIPEAVEANTIRIKDTYNSLAGRKINAD